MPTPAYHDLMVLEVPILEDDTIEALHTFLIDLVRQFGNHYVDQLNRDENPDDLPLCDAERDLSELDEDALYDDLMPLPLPILEDETVDALDAFLLHLVTQFENHYSHQLRRQRQKLDALTRDPLEPWKRITPDAADPQVDEDFNDDIPF